MNYVRYNHHGEEVWVREDLKGKHKEHCLCYNCRRFKIDEPDNCKIAEMLYRFCILTGCTTPMWECPKFIPVIYPKE